VTLVSDVAPQLGGLMRTFFDELKASGIAATEADDDALFARGFQAVETLFPGNAFGGDLSMLLSRVHTEDGGDIGIVVPGGGANAGLTASVGFAKSPDQLGVVAQRAGDVSAFVHDNFLVNQSRVFALAGGDILMWSSFGDIDAGRGAKTALAAPPPQTVFDPEQGVFVTVFPPVVSGSGIRNFAPPGIEPGRVFLFAPHGTVSAGEAGIVSAGGLFVRAVQVVSGLGGIEAAGPAVGVPATASVSLAAGLTGVSNVAASAAKGTEQQAAATAERQSAAAGQAAAEAGLALITVDFLGFGDSY
jgi:hypothetical protein